MGTKIGTFKTLKKSGQELGRNQWVFFRPLILRSKPPNDPNVSVIVRCNGLSEKTIVLLGIYINNSRGLLF